MILISSTKYFQITTSSSSFSCSQIWDTGLKEKNYALLGSVLKLFFLLAAGQERFRALRTPFYRGSDICLLSYAVNDRDSFRGLKQWREEFLKYADVDREQFPFIVVGNKVNKISIYWKYLER